MVQAVLTFRSTGERPHQEDDLLCNEQRGIFVVADGFGGPDAGAAASKLACESVRSFLEREAGDLEATLPFVLRQYFSLAGNVLFNALVHANRKVLFSNKSKNINERGGAAALAAFLDGEFLALANAGNCSASLFRNEKRVELIRARCYSSLVDPFLENENRVPLMSLGVYNDLEPEIVEVKVKPGDFLLLHTDGFSAAQIDGVSAQLKAAQSSGMSLEATLKSYFESLQFTDNACLVGVSF